MFFFYHLNHLFILDSLKIFLGLRISEMHGPVSYRILLSNFFPHFQMRGGVNYPPHVVIGLIISYFQCIWIRFGILNRNLLVIRLGLFEFIRVFIKGLCFTMFLSLFFEYLFILENSLKYFCTYTYFNLEVIRDMLVSEK